MPEAEMLGILIMLENLIRNSATAGSDRIRSLSRLEQWSGYTDEVLRAASRWVVRKVDR
jgi:hypothetical protein